MYITWILIYSRLILQIPQEQMRSGEKFMHPKYERSLLIFHESSDMSNYRCLYYPHNLRYDLELQKSPPCSQSAVPTFNVHDKIENHVCVCVCVHGRGKREREGQRKKSTRWISSIKETRQARI